jgi:intracellular sulfur oxidation DsrE/DsrF family protein
MKKIFIVALLLLPLWAQGMPNEMASPISVTDDISNDGLIARIDFEQADQILDALQRAEAYYQEGGLNLNHPPMAFVIYGPPVAIFFKDNYRDNKAIVDLAARLTALNIIDVKVCEFSYEAEGLDTDNLLPFVTTVPFGPDEETRLVEDERYNYF